MVSMNKSGMLRLSLHGRPMRTDLTTKNFLRFTAFELLFVYDVGSGGIPLRRSLIKRITAVYSNRVAVPLPQRVSSRFPFASKIWIVAL